MNRQLRLNVPLQPVHPAGRLQLLHRIVPLLPDLLFGLIGFLRGGVLDALFLVFAFRGRNKADQLALTRGHTRPQWEVPSVREHQVVEFRFYFALGSKVRVQGRPSALPARDRADFRNPANDLRPYGDDTAVKRIHRLDNASMNWLTHVLHADFLVQGHLQRCARGNGESNGLGERIRTRSARRRCRFACGAGC